MNTDPFMNAARRPSIASSPRHVVHIIGTTNFGGVQRMLLGMAGALDREHWRQSVVCIVGREGTLSEAFAQSFERVAECKIPWPSFNPPRGLYRVSHALRHRLSCTFAMRLARTLRALGPSIVHTHISTNVAAQARATLTSVRVPFVWTIHGNYRIEPEKLPDWNQAARLMGEHREMARVTGVSAHVARNAVEQVPALTDRVDVVYCGVDLAGFAPGANVDHTLRAAWGIPPSSFVFGSTGRIVDAKAYEHFVAAAATVLRRGVDAFFLLAGDGPLRTRIEDEIRQRGIGERFRLVGFQADVPKFLRSLDAFVLSSRTEGVPLSLIEAMAMRVPCIATNVGGVPEVFSSSGGVLIPPENPELLAEAMLSVVSGCIGESPLEQSSLRAAEFEMDKCAERFAGVYDALLAARDARSR